MSLIRRIGGRMLPVGSARRARVTAAARSTGLYRGPADGEYQRWVRSIEPTQWSPTLAHSGAVHVEVTVSSSAQTHDVERSMMSLQAQTMDRWTASFSGSVSPALVDTVERWRRSEPRCTPEARCTIRLTIGAGDVLSPHALNEVALAFERNPNATAVVADSDLLSASGDQRVDAVSIGQIDSDVALQYDIASSFLAVRASDSDEDRHRSPFDSSSAEVWDNVVSLPLILRHRRHRRGVPQPYPDPSDPATVTASQAVDGRHAVATPTESVFGTRLQYRTPARVAVFVRDPISGSVGARQRTELAWAFRSTEPVCTILHDLRVSPSTPASSIAAAARLVDADVCLIVDGGLGFSQPEAIADLVGALLREDVLAVAPVVVVPSGLVVDAGLVRRDDSFVARCGGFDRAPYWLARTTSVDSFSGRCFAIRTADLTPFADAEIDANTFAEVATATERRLVVWSHIRAHLTYGLADRPAAAPSITAWSSGRLGDWFGEEIAGYRPLNDSKAESVW